MTRLSDIRDATAGVTKCGDHWHAFGPGPDYDGTTYPTEDAAIEAVIRQERAPTPDPRTCPNCSGEWWTNGDGSCDCNHAAMYGNAPTPDPLLDVERLAFEIAKHRYSMSLRQCSCGEKYQPQNEHRHLAKVVAALASKEADRHE